MLAGTRATKAKKAKRAPCPPFAGHGFLAIRPLTAILTRLAAIQIRKVPHLFWMILQTSQIANEFNVKDGCVADTLLTRTVKNSDGYTINAISD